MKEQITLQQIDRALQLPIAPDNRIALIAAITAAYTDPDATRDAIVLLRQRVNYSAPKPSIGDCWLINAALRLEGRTPEHNEQDRPDWYGMPRLAMRTLDSDEQKRDRLERKLVHTMIMEKRAQTRVKRAATTLHKWASTRRRLEKRIGEAEVRRIYARLSVNLGTDQE